MRRLVIGWYFGAGVVWLVSTASCGDANDIAPPAPQGNGGGTESPGIIGGGHGGTADSASGNDGAGYVDGGAESGTAQGVDGEYGCLVGITITHNAVRARADVRDAGALPPLDWSVELASLAQAHADDLAAGGCGLYSSGSGYGENLAYFSRQVTAQQVVEQWAAEKNCYTYGMFMTTDICAAKCEQCGHYTQIVWRSTAELGCGYADCGGSGQVWVCYYNPAGNIIGQYPY